MSAMAFAKQAFVREKPHSSITDWVEILTGPDIADEAYDGIPELVDSINLQPAAGPAEASRAIRKKLKHGNTHQQYRALVILKALVENCGDKFKTSFADGHLTDVLKTIAHNSDRHYDKRVQKKLRMVLLSWHEQFKGDASMTVVANLYSQCRVEREWAADAQQQVLGFESAKKQAEDLKEAKRKAKEEKLKRKQEEEERRRQEKAAKNRPVRVPFNFETDKPKVLASIVDASQASSNLVNAITLVNREKESLLTNERVQECLATAKQARKQLVRYIQLVENEEIIGTLIEANERIISALAMYDELLAADPKTDADAIAAGLSGVQITSEVNKLQDKQRTAVERASRQNSIRGDTSNSSVHPDLHDLNFGSIGGSSNNLPVPLQPTLSPRNISDDEDNDIRASLSDFSDYESSDEEMHRDAGTWKGHVDVSDDSEGAAGISKEEADPFADPFADEVAVGPSKKW